MRRLVLLPTAEGEAAQLLALGLSAGKLLRATLAAKDGTVRDVAAASDHLNLSTLSMPVERHFLAWPKEIPPRPNVVKG